MNSVKKKLLVEIVCFSLFSLFLYAALSKLLEFNTFRFQLGLSPYLTNFSYLAALAIPIVEISISILLLIQEARLFGLYLSFLLILLFMSYIYAILNWSYFIPCSCGGLIAFLSWKQHMLFNIALALMTTTAILFQEGLQEKINHIGNPNSTI